MDIFSALADPTRRSILTLLAKQGGLSVNEIFHKFPISQPAISQHLKVLRNAKLVDVSKNEQKHIYAINTSSIDSLQNWAQEMKQLWTSRLDRLDDVLKKL